MFERDDEIVALFGPAGLGLCWGGEGILANIMGLDDDWVFEQIELSNQTPDFAPRDAIKDEVTKRVFGEGEDNALAFGGPHPCEPVGCLTIDFLSRHLCENEDFRHELGYRWHFIRCLDIDGMRLNEGWFGVPLDLGEADQAGYIEQYAPAIYRTITIQDGYERRLAAGMVDPSQGIDWGGTSNGYAEWQRSDLSS